MVKRTSSRSRYNREPSGSRPKKAIAGRPDARVLGLCFLLLFALMFGGGGSPAETAELLVQIATLAIAGLLVFLTGSSEHLPWAALRRDWLIGGLAVGLVAIYLAQLAPLPPSVWAMLPDREALATNLSAFDEQPWLALSVAPHFTIAALLSLIPPFFAYALAASTDADAWRWTLRTLALFAVLTIGLQLLQKTGSFYIYDQVRPHWSHGFQANRNTQGDILAILMAVLALRRRQMWEWKSFAAQQIGFAFALLVAVVLTGSRAGMVLTGAMFLLVCFRLLRENRRTLGRQFLLVTGVAMAAVAGAIWFAMRNPLVLRSIDRFAYGSEGRSQIVWPDAVYTMQQFFPLGAGFGAFVPAFQIFESQETFTVSLANRAHSEPLEVMIEGGIPGAVVVVALIGATLWRAWSAAFGGATDDERSRGLLLGIITLILLAHSLVDYPMRSMSIAVLFATVLGLVVADRGRRRFTNGPASGGTRANDEVAS